MPIETDIDGLRDVVGAAGKYRLDPINDDGKCVRGRPVRGGDLIGYAAKSPIHFRFALWQWTDRGFVPVEPMPKLTEWVAPFSNPNRAAIEVAA